MTKHPSQKVINFGHLLGCDTIALLGKWNLNKNEKVFINHVVLLFKRFIFDNKSNLHNIHILALLNYFKTVEKVEQKIAHQKDKLKLHFEKWDPIRHIH